MTTSKSSNENVEFVYNQIETLVSNIPNKDYVVILRDKKNVKILNKVSKNYLSGTSNSREHRLVEIATAN